MLTKGWMPFNILVQDKSNNEPMNFFIELKYRNEPLYYFGFICLVFALVCLVLTRINSTQVLGTSAWYKPFKFFLSSTIFVWSMAWFAFYLNRPSTTQWYSWILIFLFTIENVYIFLQAARGLASHFNVSTPFYSMMWSLMALAAVGISISTAVIGTSFFTNSFPDLPPAYLWGIRFGLIIFVIFSMEGLAMGARMAHTVGGADGGSGIPITNWSTRYGDLRIAHFLGMHALQILPLMGFYILRNTKGIVLISILYGLLVVATFVQALRGKPLIRQADFKAASK
jgi:hypothetical protein